MIRRMSSRRTLSGSSARTSPVELAIELGTVKITAVTSHAQIAPRVEERRQLGSPRAIDGSEPRQTSSMMMNGITKFANGMNHPPIAQPGPSRGFCRPSASLFFAARYSQMIRSTKIAIATMPDRMIIAAASPLASLTAFVSKTSPPVSLSLSTRRWLNTPMINTTVSTMWAENSHVSADVIPRRLRHLAGGPYAVDGAPPGGDGAVPSAKYPGGGAGGGGAGICGSEPDGGVDGGGGGGGGGWLMVSRLLDSRGAGYACRRFARVA